jgi:hypothetical protein
VNVNMNPNLNGSGKRKWLMISFLERTSGVECVNNCGDEGSRVLE